MAPNTNMHSTNTECINACTNFGQKSQTNAFRGSVRNERFCIVSGWAHFAYVSNLMSRNHFEWQSQIIGLPYRLICSQCKRRAASPKLKCSKLALRRLMRSKNGALKSVSMSSSLSLSPVLFGNGRRLKAFGWNVCRCRQPSKFSTRKCVKLWNANLSITFSVSTCDKCSSRNAFSTGKKCWSSSVNWLPLISSNWTLAGRLCGTAVR